MAVHGRIPYTCSHGEKKGAIAIERIAGATINRYRRGSLDRSTYRTCQTAA
jgi:hypothetical protein